MSGKIEGQFYFSLSWFKLPNALLRSNLLPLFVNWFVFEADDCKFKFSKEIIVGALIFIINFDANYVFFDITQSQNKLFIPEWVQGLLDGF